MIPRRGEYSCICRKERARRGKTSLPFPTDMKMVDMRLNTIIIQGLAFTAPETTSLQANFQLHHV